MTLEHPFSSALPNISLSALPRALQQPPPKQLLQQLLQLIDLHIPKAPSLVQHSQAC